MIRYALPVASFPQRKCVAAPLGDLATPPGAMATS